MIGEFEIRNMLENNNISEEYILLNWSNFSREAIRFTILYMIDNKKLSFVNVFHRYVDETDLIDHLNEYNDNCGNYSLENIIFLVYFGKNEYMVHYLNSQIVKRLQMNKKCL